MSITVKNVFLSFSGDTLNTHSRNAEVRLEFPNAAAADKFIKALMDAPQHLPEGVTQGDIFVEADAKVKVSVNAGKLTMIGREYELDEPLPQPTSP